MDEMEFILIHWNLLKICVEYNVICDDVWDDLDMISSNIGNHDDHISFQGYHGQISSGCSLEFEIDDCLGVISWIIGVD